MNQQNVRESDWKLFRKKLPAWQEAYMDRLNQEYAALLTGPGAASDKFWELDKRIREDKTHVGVIARMSRSEMYYNLLALLNEGAITREDLQEFSEDLKERISLVLRRENE